MLKFIRPSPNSVFNCCNCKGIKCVTRLRLGLNHLCEHKFKHSFQDTPNPFCSCGLAVQTNTHLFLYCLLLSNQRCTLLGTLNYTDSSLANTNDSILTYILLFGKASLICLQTSSYLMQQWNISYIISKQISRKSFFSIL